MLSRAQKLLLRLSLHLRIAVFVSSILFAVFVAFGYIGWEAVSQSTANTIKERQATARVLAGHLDNLIAHAQAHLIVVASEISRSGLDLHSAEVESVLDHALPQMRFFFSWLLLFDREGRLVLVTPSLDVATVNLEVQAIVDEAVQNERPVISNLVQLPVTGATGILFVVPIVRNGDAIGALAGEVRLPHFSFSSVALALELGDTGHVEVLDERGRIIVLRSPEDIGLETEHRDFYAPLLASRMPGVGPAYPFGETYGDEAHITAFVPLVNAPWGAGVGQSEAETFRAALALRDRALAVALVALIVALGCTWIGTQSVVGPIKSLTDDGERMATGDLSSPIQIVQPDEIGRLAYVLEAMRQRLGRSVAEIRALNHELEQRVHARTRELEVSNRHLQALTTVATTASRGLAPTDVLNTALRELVTALKARDAWALLWDEERRQMRFAGDNLHQEAIWIANGDDPRPRVPCLEALMSATTSCSAGDFCSALNGSPVHGNDGVRCWSTPIQIGEQMVGALCVSRDTDKGLEAAERTLLNGVAQQVAFAFENTRLSEERARLEAARRVEVVRAELLASVSHELRTPLGFIKGYTTTMLRNDVNWDDSQRREFLGTIDEECDRLTELIDSLLDAARIQAGRLQLHAQPTDLEGVLRRSVERLASSLSGHTIELCLRVSPTIIADATRLEQVVVNLLQNAVKYSPNGDPIEVHLDSAEQGIRIGVLDHGMGVSATEATKIFEPFYRGQDGPAKEIGGAGLGLAICRAIVEAHGGQIWAEPRTSGGTAVYLTLPSRVSALDAAS
jgi:signal transduction histidine kinase/HAMP domain-containing protein